MSIVASMYVMYRFSMLRCMKWEATKYALTTAMPNAVMRVIIQASRNPNSRWGARIGPKMLAMSSTRRMAQIFT